MTDKARAQTLQQRFGFQDKELTTPAHDAIMMWLNGHVADVCRGLFPKGNATDWEEDVVLEAQETARRLMARYRSGLSLYRKELIERKESYLSRFKMAPYDTSARGYAEQTAISIAKIDGLLCDTSQSWVPKVPPYPGFLDPELIEQPEWEHPILSGKYTVGFVDMKVWTYGYPRLLFTNISGAKNVVDVGTIARKLPKEDEVHSIGNSIYTPCMDIAEWGWPSLHADWAREVNILFEIKPSIPSVGELIRQIQMYKTYESGHYVVVSPDDRWAEILKQQGINLAKCPAP